MQEIMVKAAWLYHVEGLTQAQIGERLNLTRRRVNELLAAALQNGLVRISFASPLAENVALEAELASRFGLSDVVVAPTPADPAQLHSVLGRAAAGFLDRTIPVLKPSAIGVGWGATLRQTVQHMRQRSEPQIGICSMMGGLMHGAEINTFEIVRSFAQVLGAYCHYFAAPVYADSGTSRDLIVAQPVFRELLDEAASVEMTFLSVGDVTGQSLQVRYGLPKQVDIASIVAAGGVGDLLGYYLDENGRPIDHPVNKQAISVELGSYKRVPCRIVASGGPHKRDILRALLRARLATVIVTDADTARWLLINNASGEAAENSS